MLDTGHFYLLQIEYAPSVFIRSLNIWLECAHNIAQKRVE